MANGLAMDLGGDRFGHAGQDGEGMDAVVIADRTGSVSAAELELVGHFHFSLLVLMVGH
jgi:hypothetical protein